MNINYITAYLLVLGIFSGCSQLARPDPSLLYSCIDTMTIDSTRLDNPQRKRTPEEQLEAFESCIKRN